jgi:preprotein translocase subunit Sec63
MAAYRAASCLLRSSGRVRWRDVRPLDASSTEALAKRSPEDILRVAPDASCAEIKAAYRRLARAYHPDIADPFVRRRNQEMLKLVNRAYEALARSRGC